jgi:RNA polymerase sigma factor (sigma-70 family)
MNAFWRRRAFFLPAGRNLLTARDMYSLIMGEPGHKQRFHGLYEANYARILGYALRRTDCAEDAADIVADTFALAWRRLADVPPGEEAVLWLYGVARRMLANQRRKERSRGAVVEMLAQEYDEVCWVDPVPVARSISRALVDAWKTLTPADRDLLGLMVWETLSTEQIATVIGCSRAVAKVRIHRARRRLARELERRGYPLKPETLARHVQAGRAGALPDTEAM